VADQITRCAAGSSKRERYTSLLLRLLKEERQCGTDATDFAQPLCAILKSRKEQTLYRGLAELFHYITTISFKSMSLNGAVINHQKQVNDECSESSLQDQESRGCDFCALVPNLFTFGAFESCWDLALTGRSSQVVDISVEILSTFVLRYDGIGRLLCCIEQELQGLAIFCVQEPHCRSFSTRDISQESRAFEMIDVLLRLQDKSECFVKIIDHVILQDQTHRATSLCFALLNLSANFSSLKMHTVSRKVNALVSELFRTWSIILTRSSCTSHLMVNDNGESIAGTGRLGRHASHTSTVRRRQACIRQFMSQFSVGCFGRAIGNWSYWTRRSMQRV
jgi:hypothetical protein